MQFDARQAKLLKPGLRLEATPSTKTWTYRYKSPVDGRTKQAALGQWPHMGIMEAAQAKRSQRGSGVEPGKPKRVAPVRVYTVGALVTDYISGHIQTGRAEAGAVAAERRLQAAIQEISSRPASSSTRADAFDLLEAQKATPTAAAKVRGLLGGAWDWTLADWTTTRPTGGGWCTAAGSRAAGRSLAANIRANPGACRMRMRPRPRPCWPGYPICTNSGATV